MDRRSLLMLAATLPVFSAQPAGACSLALKSPRSAGFENQQIQRMFEAWWERDADKFRRYFTATLMSDGSPMEAQLAKELLAANPIPPKTFEIFDRFFTDARKLNRITLILNTQAGLVVGCSEADTTINIRPDCTGMPKLHLFLVVMSGLNPRSIAHLATTETPEPGKFNLWTDGTA